MPDPLTTGVTIGTAISVVARQAQDFIASAWGHPGESIGSILGDIAKRCRDNAEAVGAKAHLTLLNIGVEPQPIALPVLMPTLQGASLEEEPSMQDVWANLLANAADPRKIAPVAATFPVILRELSARDVRFLDAIERETKSLPALQTKSRRIPRNASQEQRRTATENAQPFTEDQLESIFNGTEQTVIQPPPEDFEYSLDVLMRHNLIAESIGLHVLSELGRRFIAACRKPTLNYP